MNKLTKGQRTLARAMIPASVCVAALCFMAFRPCEPVAQASVEQPVLRMAEVTIVADAVVPEVSVESLPKVRQYSAKPMAHIAAKPVCDPFGLQAVCESNELLQGTIGTHALYCHCN